MSNVRLLRLLSRKAKPVVPVGEIKRRFDGGSAMWISYAFLAGCATFVIVTTPDTRAAADTQLAPAATAILATLSASQVSGLPFGTGGVAEPIDVSWRPPALDPAVLAAVAPRTAEGCHRVQMNVQTKRNQARAHRGKADTQFAKAAPVNAFDQWPHRVRSRP